MNREIKFRVWDKYEKQMYPISSIDYNIFSQEIRIIAVGHKNGMCTAYNKNHNSEKCDITALELMQYTGLHDKNGKEIYEGDIIEWTTLSGKKYRFSVEYSNKYAQYIITNTGDVENEAEPLGDYENIEVIGNVFENGDILNDSKNTEKN